MMKRMMNRGFIPSESDGFMWPSILPNPFVTIYRQGEDAVPSAVEDFLATTSGFGRISGASFRKAEKLLMSALFYYLYLEAPAAEMNLCLVAALIASAAMKDMQGESDLDLLINHLRRIEGGHIALEHYDEYKELAGKSNLVVNSCRRRLYPLFTMEDNSVFEHIRDEEDIPNLAMSLVLNLRSVEVCDMNKYEYAEVYLLTSLLLYAYKHHHDEHPMPADLIELITSGDFDRNVSRLSSDDKALMHYNKWKKLAWGKGDVFHRTICNNLRFFTEFA